MRRCSSSPILESRPTCEQNCCPDAIIPAAKSTMKAVFRRDTFGKRQGRWCANKKDSWTEHFSMCRKRRGCQYMYTMCRLCVARTLSANIMCCLALPLRMRHRSVNSNRSRCTTCNNHKVNKCPRPRTGREYYHPMPLHGSITCAYMYPWKHVWIPTVPRLTARPSSACRLSWSTSDCRDFSWTVSTLQWTASIAVYPRCKSA